jgi:PAS domain S-box-containing protein
LLSKSGIGMKTTNCMSSGEVPLAGSAVLLGGLQKGQTGEAASKDKNPSNTFPFNLLTVSLFITATTIAWTSYGFFSSSPAKLGPAALISTGLLIVCFTAWFMTARGMLVYNRAAAGAADIVRERDHLLRERELMRTIIDNLPDRIYAKDRQGRFVLNNTVHASSKGTSPKEMLGKTDFDYSPEHLAMQFFADEQALMESGKPILNQEQFVPVAGRPGEHTWIAASKVIWRDREGNILGTAGISRDINAMKLAQEALRRSEEKLRQFTMQLERSNRELQDFAYVASHDLQEPLRKIVVFGERLKEKCAEEFSVEGRDYLERMQKAAARMQILINDLLSFSRVTTKAQPFVSVDLAKTAREVVSDLEARIEMVKGRVEVGPLPLLEAEPLQMRQLLQNLIGNALKFRRPDEAPVVKVEAKVFAGPRPRMDAESPAEQLCQLTISDNGIGFEEKYLDRIFNVFQRLHTRNEYEGTGMGLAIARKIALYHGGDITATSKVGQGSAFIVTLPVIHPKDQEKEKEAQHEQ